MPSAASTPTIIPPGKGDAYWVVGDNITLKLGPEQTGGRFGLAETVTGPGIGPPPHVHSREDEMFYIVEGDFGFVFDQHTSTGTAGDMVYLPKGIVHAFKNVGQTPGKLLIVTTPCGFESFVPEAGSVCKTPGETPPAVDDAAIGKLLTACAKYGLEMKFDYQPGPPAPPPEAAKEYWVWGVHVRVMLDAAQTRGNFSVAEVTCDPGAGVPPHTHRAMDEFFYVKSGTFEFHLAGGNQTAAAGTVIHVPPGAVHGFRNVGEGPAVLVDYHTPGGFEAFFAEAGVPCTDRSKPPQAGPPDMAAAIALCEKHGMTLGG